MNEKEDTGLYEELIKLCRKLTDTIKSNQDLIISVDEKVDVSVKNLELKIDILQKEIHLMNLLQAFRDSGEEKDERI